MKVHSTQQIFDLDFDIVLPEKDFAVLVVPKCGGSTMRKAVKNVQCPRSEALEMSQRLAVVRHPVARVVSAWNNNWPGWLFGDWWEQVRENPHFDIHTYPAVDIVRGDATDIRALELITDWWREYQDRGLFPRSFPHENRAKTYGWVNLIEGGFASCVDDIKRVYRDDMMLWEGAYGSWR